MAATEPTASEALGRRERKKQETRARILEAAARLFAATGVESTTVDALAEAADVSRGTFFNYFPEKSAVVAALGDALVDRFEVGISRARALEASTTGRLAALFAGSAREMQRAPDLSRALLLESVTRPQDLGDRIGRTTRMHEGLAALLEDGIRQGDVRTDLPVSLLAAVVSGGFIEVLTAWMGDPAYPLGERLGQAAGLLGYALAPPPDARRPS